VSLSLRWLVALAVLVPRVAAADEPPPTGLLDRADGVSRAGVSPVYLARGWFARGDVAVDVPVHSGTCDDLPTIGRVNGAVGLRVLRHSVYMLELVNLIAIEEPERETSDRWIGFLGLTGAFNVDAAWQPLASLVVPLDDEVNDAVSLAMIVGVEAKLP
jgi:hypothetical protein